MKSLFILVFTSSCSLLLSCVNSSEKEQIDFAVADTASITGLTDDSVKLVKTAGIHCKVRDVHAGSKAVSQLARSFDGMITHLNIASTENETKKLKVSKDSLLQVFIYSTNATITARIPAANLEAFLLGVADIGYFNFNTQMDIEDKSLDYLSAQLKQNNRIQFQQKVGEKKVKEATSFGMIEIKDQAIDKEIVKRQIDANVQYSLVHLNLFQNPQVRKEMIANDSIEDYELPLSKNMGNALAGGWEMFLNFFIALAHLWAFIVAAILIWIGVKYYRLANGGSVQRNLVRTT